MYKHRIHCLPVLVALLFTLGCDPNDPQPEPKGKDFSCIKLKDENGLDFGEYGDCSTAGQWGAISLNDEERALLNFNDTVSLNNTVLATISEVAGFPNPVRQDGALALSVRSDVAGQAVKVKLAVVDSTLTVVQQAALRVNTNSTFALAISSGTYNIGQYYRVYYRVSAAGKEDLFEGYGNFLVCKMPLIPGSTTIEMDCK